MEGKKAANMKKPAPKRLRKVKTRGPLTVSQAKAALKGVSGWQLSSNSKVIYRDLVVKDFMTAIHLINQIARIAEDKNHHPDIHLTAYRILHIELTTHEVGGLSEVDFIEAGKINGIPVELKP